MAIAPPIKAPATASNEQIGPKLKIPAISVNTKEIAAILSHACVSRSNVLFTFTVHVAEHSPSTVLQVKTHPFSFTRFA